MLNKTIYTLLLIFSFTNACCSQDSSYLEVCGIPVALYESLEFTNLSLRKQAITKGASREVYYDPSTNCFIKVWSEDYEEKEAFLLALKSGFYEDLALIKAIIFDRNFQCRGYIIPCLASPLQLSFVKNKYGWDCLDLTERQNLYFQSFFCKLIEKSVSTGFYYIDLVPHNLIKENNTYYLIDLESVVTKGRLHNIYANERSKFEIILEHLSKDYAQFLYSIIQ